MLSSMQSHGVHLSEDGTGQVLIFPYYTVNNDFNSLLTITNTTQQAKALRVRFREAANSREVFAFNLYLGANDMWTTGLIKIDDTDVKLITSDNSCTVPNLHNQTNLFSKNHFTGDMQDAYGDDDNRLFEGFVEVIEMGELTGNSELAATLVELGTPSPYNCSDLANAWDVNHAENYWVQEATTDLLPPRGGISGDLTLISVIDGIAMNAKPTVIENFSNVVLHHNIDNDSPSLADGMLNSRVVGNNGRYYDITWDSGIKSLSSVLMVSSFDNEYEVNADFGANTTWITTLPTKQYFTDPLYAIDAPVEPFTQIIGTNNDMQYNCESFSIDGLYNREEAPRPPPFPGQITTLPTQLCYATNSTMINFESVDETEDLFESQYRNTIHTTYHEGWMQLSFANTLTQGHITLRGLPMIGFAAQNYVNGTLPDGVLANYATISEHKTSSDIMESPTLPQVVPPKMKLNTGGIGQVLIYPYYTVRNGFDTLITLVNTTDEVKAVKIRFREGKNARDVLDFNLYLSAKDVWTAALVATQSSIPNHIGESSVKLLTNDTSCTVPAINGQEFLPYGYDPQDNANAANGYDQQGTNLVRTQEGFIEIIEMGTVTGEDAENAMHIDGIPNNCEALIANWALGSGKWMTNPNENLQAPNGSGGLSGSAKIINVESGLNLGYVATAIQGYSTEIQHSLISSIEPNLSSGNNATTLINTDNGALKTTWDSPIDAVSALFMHDTTTNSYDINDFAGAQTDWVVMSPTRHYYTDTLYDANNPKSPYGNGITPNETEFCQRFGFKSYDREQKPNSVFGPVPSPNPPGNYDMKLCNSVNVSFADNSSTFLNPTNNSLFDSQLLIEDWIVFYGNTPMYHMLSNEGLMQMNLDDGDNLVGINAEDNTESHTIYGKPIINFTAQKYVNGNLDNGVLANYSVIKEDTSTRKIEIVATAQ